VRAEEWKAAIERWLRAEHVPGYRTAVEWLLPRCRTEEERALAPALLLLLAPLNGLVAPCRPVAGSRVNFQVTVSRQTEEGAERVRLTVRARREQAAAGADQALAGPAVDPVELEESPAAPEEAEAALYLETETVLARPLVCAACVLERLMLRSRDSR
jgi:hypothetical protein